MGEAARAFADSVKYGAELAKARTRRKRRPILLRQREEYIVSPDEVIGEIRKLGGPEISRRTLRLWEEKGLIPQARRGSLGRGKGGFADYPADAPLEGVVAAKLLRDGVLLDYATNAWLKLTLEDVRNARCVGQALLRGPIPLREYHMCRLERIWEYETRRQQHVLKSSIPGEDPDTMLGPRELEAIMALVALKHRPLVHSLRHGFQWAAWVFAMKRGILPFVEIWEAEDGSPWACLIFNVSEGETVRLGKRLEDVPERSWILPLLSLCDGPPS